MIVRLIRGMGVVGFVGWLALAGCSAPPIVVQDIRLILNPSGRAPLAALCTFTTDRPARPVLKVSDGEHTFSVSPDQGLVREHAIQVLGLRPGKTHTITISVTGEEQSAGTADPLLLTTAALPGTFPRMELAVSEPSRMEPGLTLLPLMRWNRGALDDTFGLIVIVDAKGDVVWYYTCGQAITKALPIRNGNMVYLYGRYGNMVEIDMLGNLVRQWHSTGIPKAIAKGSIPVETDTFHHDFFEMASGNFLVPSSEVREFEEYPTSDTEPDAPRKKTNVIGDVLVEFTPEGRVVDRWGLFDILDPYRIGYGSLSGGFWASIYMEFLDIPGKDWSHLNSVFHDPRDDSLLLSCRHQDAVFKVSRTTGELKWILGNHGGWNAPWDRYLLEPKGDLSWPFHQHAATVTPQGTILMYDNGTYHARPFEKKMSPKDNFSRVVEYAVDEEAMEVTQVWTYGGPGGEHFYSPLLCDVDWLPKTGNVLITDGARSRGYVDVDPDAPTMGQRWARIVEVTHTTPPVKVFELTIDDEEPAGWVVNRSERIAGLYP